MNEFEKRLDRNRRIRQMVGDGLSAFCGNDPEMARQFREVSRSEIFEVTDFVEGILLEGSRELGLREEDAQLVSRLGGLLSDLAIGEAVNEQVGSAFAVSNTAARNAADFATSLADERRKQLPRGPDRYLEM